MVPGEAPAAAVSSCASRRLYCRRQRSIAVDEVALLRTCSQQLIQVSAGGRSGFADLGGMTAVEVGVSAAGEHWGSTRTGKRLVQGVKDPQLCERPLRAGT